MSGGLSVQALYEASARPLGLNWLAGLGGGSKRLEGETVQKPTLALIGHLNFVHPNRVQVLGCAEMDYLRKLTPAALTEAIDHLFSTELAAVVIANGESVPDSLKNAAERTQTPLFTSPLQSPTLMAHLSHLLTQELAETTLLHGVCLEVIGVGLLLQGEAAVGKSELALELITRGHRLVADDAVELKRVAPHTLEASCPVLLRDYLEVRGLGLLNIRQLYGETAVKLQKNLKLVIELVSPHDVGKEGLNRLDMEASHKQILGVDVPLVRIPVAAGRNLAVLVEVAVRNHIMKSRGIDPVAEFSQRQSDLMSDGSL
jgi:HPr kinase/phosphorylase